MFIILGNQYIIGQDVGIIEYKTKKKEVQSGYHKLLMANKTCGPEQDIIFTGYECIVTGE